MKKLKILLFGPILLGYLVNRSQGFFYISKSRFLYDQDQGEYELNYLKVRGKRIIQWFTGSDIRSLVLSQLVKKSDDFESFADIIPLDNPQVMSNKYDLEKRRLAEITDRYADLVFSNDLDQISYLRSQISLARPILNADNFNFDFEKFHLGKADKVQIVHVTSNPLIKGTPLVMAAINRLQTEGFEFDFKILINTNKSDVLIKLQQAHIVLGQFYSRTPGHAGAEALANTTILLQSVPIEEMRQANKPWIETYSHEIYDNLKKVIIDFHFYIDTAIAGYKYAASNFHILNIAQEFQSEIENRFSQIKK